MSNEKIVEVIAISVTMSLICLAVYLINFQPQLEIGVVGIPAVLWLAIVPTIALSMTDKK